MTKFRDLGKNFELSSEKSLELNSTSREAVIAVESRDHAKNNGVSPKDHTSRGNKMYLFYVIAYIVVFSTVFVACDKDNDNGNNGGRNSGKTIEDFPPSFAKKLFENWDCSQWLKLYYSAQGFNGIETMHCIQTFDCETEIGSNVLYEDLYEKGYALLSSSSYNQNTKCVTIYFAERSGNSWIYYACIFYTIDVIK